MKLTEERKAALLRLMEAWEDTGNPHFDAWEKQREMLFGKIVSFIERLEDLPSTITEWQVRSDPANTGSEERFITTDERRARQQVTSTTKLYKRSVTEWEEVDRTATDGGVEIQCLNCERQAVIFAEHLTFHQVAAGAIRTGAVTGHYDGTVLDWTCLACGYQNDHHPEGI